MKATSTLFRINERYLSKTPAGRIVFILFISLSSLSGFHCVRDQTNSEIAYADSAAMDTRKSDSAMWVAPDSTLLTTDPNAELLLYGKSLLSHTSEYFGPKGSIATTANGMNCQNCHLKGGTKLFANNYSAIYSTYPRFRPRSGTVENLVKRINDCFERSMNGEKLDSNSKEMKAMIAYINWVGKDVPKGVIPEGASVPELKFLDRAADPVKGKGAFEQKCVICHGTDGRGKLAENGKSFTYPPLWGPSSYNTAAGMYRLVRLAGFIKANMPYGTSYTAPVLTDEEAWDIAAYINSMDRPEKKFKDDWPDISKKPIDHPFGPYADTFSERQHKYGPFQPIKEFYTRK